jgi:hypothetical protein
VTEQAGSIQRFNDQEQVVLLATYNQRYEHVRHVQQMRAAYFNLYAAIIGAGLAAATTLLTQFKELPGEVPFSLGLFLYVISILTMMRSERWGGHISHDLRTIRELQNIFSSRYASLGKVIPVHKRPMTSFEYDRPLWSRNRSIETPASVLGAFASSAVVGYGMALWGLPEWVCAIAGFGFAVGAILLWRAEVENLKKRHAECCVAPEVGTHE